MDLLGICSRGTIFYCTLSDSQNRAFSQFRDFSNDFSAMIPGVHVTTRLSRNTVVYSPLIPAPRHAYVHTYGMNVTPTKLRSTCRVGWAPDEYLHAMYGTGIRKLLMRIHEIQALPRDGTSKRDYTLPKSIKSPVLWPELGKCGSHGLRQTRNRGV